MSDDDGGDAAAPSAGEPVLAEGLVYRESTVVPGIVKKRYCVLFADRFATRARADAAAAGFGRVWPLSPACSLSSVHRRKLSVLGTKQHHSLWALLSGNYEDRDLFRFTLTAGEHTAALAFDEAGEAAAWHAAFVRALDALGGDGSGGGGGSEDDGAATNGATPRPPPPAGGGRPATPGWRGAGGVRRVAASVAASAARRVGYASGGGGGGGSHGGAGDAGADDLAAAAAGSGGSAGPLVERSASAAALERDLGRVLQACMTRRTAAAAAAAAVAEADGPTAAPPAPASPPAAAAAPPLPRPRPAGLAPVGLVPWYTEDGVTAYCGRDADGDDVLVESFVVRAPPRLCVATLLRGETEGGATAFGGPQADPPQLLAVVDAHTQYLRLRWRPSGWLGAALVAPRELTLKRAWRRDDDGQYVVLYTSVGPGEAAAVAAEAAAAAAAGAAGAPTGDGAAAHPPPPAAPPPPPPPPQADGGWYGEWAPAAAGGGVRGRVLSSGYTFAPLLPEYDPARACGETLVTHVAKLDAGGVVGALRRCRSPLARALAGPAWGALLHPLAQRSVLLKHRAEAERFVARPFLAGARSGTAGAGHPALALAGLGGLGFGGGGDAGAVPASPPAAPPPPPPPEAARVAALATNRSIFRRGPAAAAAGAAVAAADASAAGPPTPQQQQPSSPPPPPPPPQAVGTMPPSMWSCPGAAGFKVRGPHYLDDHRKVEAGATVLELASVDLVELDAPAFNVARFLPSIRDSASPFSFVVNLMIPGARPYSVVIAWAADRGFAAPPPPASGGAGGPLDRGGSGSVGGGGGGGGGTSLSRFESVAATASATATASTTNDDDGDAAAASPFDLALARFLAGGDSPQANARRDDTFKLIPRVAEGPWVVRQSVGSTPCLLGHKLRQRYARGPNYVEVDIDVASSSVAATVVGLVMGATKAVVVDLAIVLQGNAADELPEALLGTVRLARVDMGAARFLDTRDGKIYPAGERPADMK